MVMNAPGIIVSRTAQPPRPSPLTADIVLAVVGPTGVDDDADVGLELLRSRAELDAVDGSNARISKVETTSPVYAALAKIWSINSREEVVVSHFNNSGPNIVDNANAAIAALANVDDTFGINIDYAGLVGISYQDAGGALAPAANAVVTAPTTIASLQTVAASSGFIGAVESPPGQSTTDLIGTWLVDSAVTGDNLFSVRSYHRTTAGAADSSMGIVLGSIARDHQVNGSFSSLHGAQAFGIQATDPVLPFRNGATTSDPSRLAALGMFTTPSDRGNRKLWNSRLMKGTSPSGIAHIDTLRADQHFVRAMNNTTLDLISAQLRSDVVAQHGVAAYRQTIANEVSAGAISSGSVNFVRLTGRTAEFAATYVPVTGVDVYQLDIEVPAV